MGLPILGSDPKSVCFWCIQKGNWKDKQAPPSSGNPLKMTAVRKGISWLICGGSFSSAEKPEGMLSKVGEARSFKHLLFHSGEVRTPPELPASVICSYLLCSPALLSVKQRVRQPGWAGTLGSGRRTPLCTQERRRHVQTWFLLLHCCF